MQQAVSGETAMGQDADGTASAAVVNGAADVPPVHAVPDEDEDGTDDDDAVDGSGEGAGMGSSSSTSGEKTSSEADSAKKGPKKRRKRGWKIEVEAAQEDLPIGWKHTSNGMYTTNDGIMIASVEDALKYLGGKKISDLHRDRITKSLAVLLHHLPKPPAKRPPAPPAAAPPPPPPATKRGGGGSSKSQEIPSYLRARFQDRGSSLPDKPRIVDGQELPLSPLLPRNRRRGPAELLDNNVLLFGQWYRKLVASNKGGQKAGAIAAEAGSKEGGAASAGGGDGRPELQHLRQFVLDKKAYWGDEIALRVFAGLFKVVVAVVLQMEERLQVIHPPCGGASLISYLVLTHRGSVPHYRGVAVSDRHVLQIGGSDDDGSGAGGILNQGMVGRLLEDCPDGWSDALSLESASFMGIGKDRPSVAIQLDVGGHGGNGVGHSCPQQSPEADRTPTTSTAGEGSGSPITAAEAPDAAAAGVGGAGDAGGGTKRRKVVLCKDTLKEVTSQSGIAGLRESGKAQDVFVIDGFNAGTHFVERITCSPSQSNPSFALSNTPGDGDCLFYALADVANEMGGQSAFASSASHLGVGELLSRDGSNGLVTADLLRALVADSLSETELAFFRAANDL